ncbi:MAG: WD40 repeat domain-containing protein [Cytophagales bacterium]|nr:WD40 repeat domain-containing protein [Bernardetiaceae bacterium]MDW8210473.1 WD40 repeat domain-containing protein [Cytophagales bacterium]
MQTRIQVKKLATFTGHVDSVYALALAGGDSFYSAGSDGMLVQWNKHQPEKGYLFARLSGTVYALYHLLEEQALFVGQNYQGIYRIQTDARRVVASSAIPHAAIFDIGYFHAILFVATSSGELIAFSADKLQTTYKWQLSQKSLRCIALHPSLLHMAIGSSDHQIYILELPSMQPVATLCGHTNSVFSLTYSPCGKYLLSGSRDAHLRIWQVHKHYALAESIVAHMYTINHIAYSPSGKWFITCSKDKSIKLWEASTFTLRKVIDRARHAGHGTSVNKLLWLNDCQFISASDDRTLSLWEFEELSTRE